MLSPGVKEFLIDIPTAVSSRPRLVRLLNVTIKLLVSELLIGPIAYADHDGWMVSLAEKRALSPASATEKAPAASEPKGVAAPAGPIARNVTDAAVLLGAATGVDPNDSATAAQTGHAFTDYTQFLNDHALQGKRIGVWRAGTYDPVLVGPVVEPILDHTIAALKARGATVIDPTDIDLSATVNEGPALSCEFKTDVATYLQTYVHGTNPVTQQPYPRTLADLIAFDAAHPNLEGPWNDAVFEGADATNGRDAACAALRAATTQRAMLPPSPHPDGGFYEWAPGHRLVDFQPIPNCPDFIYDAIERTPHKPKAEDLAPSASTGPTLSGDVAG
jgi:hypothetical protein